MQRNAAEWRTAMLLATFRLPADHGEILMASALSLVPNVSGEPFVVETDAETVTYRVACDA